jgi:hypothetical protein
MVHAVASPAHLFGHQAAAVAVGLGVDSSDLLDQVGLLDHGVDGPSGFELLPFAIGRGGDVGHLADRPYREPSAFWQSTQR